MGSDGIEAVCVTRAQGGKTMGRHGSNGGDETTAMAL